MQRQQGLASDASILPALPERSTDPGHIQALRRNRRTFTVADQVDRLVGASEAAPDRGFMARMMALCCLPRSNPGNRKEYKRVNGPFTLYMIAGGGNKLPFGNLPRLLMAWLCSEAVRTQSRILVLGDTLSDFMRSLDVYSSSGQKHTRLRNQMKRLFGCSVSMIYEDEHGKQFVNSHIADRGEFWWSHPAERKPWESKIELGEKFFQEIISHPVPLNLNTLTALKRSPLGLDLYLWLTYRTFTLRAPLRLSWPLLYGQFGAVPTKASDKRTVDNFRTKCLRELKKIKLAWPELNYTTAPGVLILHPSTPIIAPVEQAQLTS